MSLAVPAESRLELLSLLRDYRSIYLELFYVLEPVLEALKQSVGLVNEAADQLRCIMDSSSCENYLKRNSPLIAQKDTHYVLRPFLMGFDANLTLAPLQSTEVIYCGIYRQILQDILSTVKDQGSVVYDAIKLLGDKTRFDILCFLRSRSACGQEISDQLGLARNTIHHHMTKLLSAHLVKCTVDGNRVYYRVDEETVSRLLDRLRKLLMPQ